MRRIQLPSEEGFPAPLCRSRGRSRPGGVDLSVFYSESDNFSPSSGSVQIDFKPLDSRVMFPTDDWLVSPLIEVTLYP